MWMFLNGQVNPRTLIPSKISGVNSKERWERLYVKIKVNFGILSKENGTIFQLEHVASYYPPCQDEWRKSCKIMTDIPAISCTRDITEYIQKCQKRQKAEKPKHNKTPLIITDTPINAFDRVIMDTIGPLPKSENGNE